MGYDEYGTIYGGSMLLSTLVTCTGLLYLKHVWTLTMQVCTLSEVWRVVDIVRISIHLKYTKTTKCVFQEEQIGMLGGCCI
jgi:hypothetical protein